jgi:hypothetical protein
MFEAIEFQQFNGFYKRSDHRMVVFKLYKGICQGCNENLNGREDYDTSHILPRSKPEEFEKLFPGLDVDNLLNLYLLCHKCNRGVGKFYVNSPALLHRVYSYSARKIKSGINKVLSGKLVNVEILNTSLSHKLRVDWKDVNRHGVCYTTYHKLPIELLENHLFKAIVENGIETTCKEAHLAHHLLRNFESSSNDYIVTRESSEFISYYQYFYQSGQLETAKKEVEGRFKANRENQKAAWENEKKWLYLSGPLDESPLPQDVVWSSEKERTAKNLLNIYIV